MGRTAANAAGRASHRAMTAAEVAELAAAPGISIGAHSVTHSVLARLPGDEQHRELAESRGTIESIIGRPVPSAAYPFGTTEDYSAETTQVARAAGFRYAMANTPLSAWRGSDAHELPRFLVRDWNAEEFTSRLAQWLEA